MEARTRDLFAEFIYGYARLSECGQPKAALIVRGESILGIGRNKLIIPGSNAEYSAIRVALCQYFLNYPNVYSFDKEKDILFSTYFPKMHEVDLIIESNIRTIYYMGEIDDLESYNFFNTYQRNRDLNDFEFICLKKD